jgi:histone deacetylase 6
MGFCFFNNAALVANRAVHHYNLKRVMIIDFDIHHGQATSRMFWDSCEVLYFSIHRSDNGKFYPNNEEFSSAKSIGGKYLGFNINCALNGGKMGDAEYQWITTFLLLPIVKSFQPQLVVFSAGFDALEFDPIGGYEVTSECLAGLVHRVLSVEKQTKAILILEGGYSVSHTATAFCDCLQSLINVANEINPIETWPLFTKENVKIQAIDAINKTIEAHQKYWPKLKPI